MLCEIAFVGLVSEWANATQAKTCCGDKSSHPELDEWRMLRIDAKIRVPDVRDTRSNVVRLVNREAVQSGCNSGTDDGSANNQE